MDPALARAVLAAGVAVPEERVINLLLSDLVRHA
jgi:hypothetical protein